MSKPGNVTIERFSDDGKSLGKETVAKVIKTEEEWKKQLASAPQPDLTFYVTRQEGTERAFTGPNWDNHSAGLYRCICCDNALYTNETKYDSGTGWPSFWRPIAKENVTEIKDTSYGMVRTAVSCTLCDAHLGHVFDDGPQPTGLRYCMDGVAMRFIPWPVT
ncbi:MAG TPA: peptide-methionine (R)-S-oxide reductase MsrB [Bauldia sp.]|nr:peptide-methionine (R)-S-oxide reductase MsrB [Bauldia sp.]